MPATVRPGPSPAAPAARRLLLRVLALTVAELALQMPPIFLVALPLSFGDAAALAGEIGANALLLGLGLAVVLELHERRAAWGGPALRVATLWTAACAVVLLSVMLIDGSTAIRLGLSSSQRSLQLHSLWNNAVFTIVALVYLTRKRSSIEAEQRCHQHEMQWRLARRRIDGAAARAAQARLDPQVLFDCLGEAQAAYRLDGARADRLLDRLTDYLRLTLSGTREGIDSLAQAVEVALASMALAAPEGGAQVTVALSPEAALQPFPPGLLGPLLSDWTAGLATGKAGGALSLTARRHERLLRIEIEGDSPPPASALADCRARLSEAHGEPAHLVVDQPGAGRRCLVTMEIADDH
ncbi:MAG: hypothetical protein K8R60_23925 [Burkholderiales bacterium]|nr:hypothetical protein [Burkholderiales bacterium]